VTKFIRATALSINELSDYLPSLFGCHTFQFTKLMLDGRPISTDIGVQGNPCLFIYRRLSNLGRCLEGGIHKAFYDFDVDIFE